MTRTDLLKSSRDQTIREILTRIFYGEWTPGVDDQVVFEKLEELGE